LPDRSQVFGAVAGDGVDEVIKLVLGILFFVFIFIFSTIVFTAASCKGSG
jgi:hypothetical protein